MKDMNDSKQNLVGKTEVEMSLGKPKRR